MGSSLKISILFFACSLLIIQGTLAEEVLCENLPTNQCSFSVASSGKRCELFRNYSAGPVFELKCRASDVVSEKVSGHVEREECVKACGVNPEAVGIGAEAFVSSTLATRACLPECYEKCPNIIDLFSHLSKRDESVGLKIISLCEKGN